MTTSRTSALSTLTDPSNRTEWLDEQSDVPPITDQDRRIFQSWLSSCDSPVASDSNVWRAITSNWVGFLSATSLKPNTILAPNRKRIRWSSGLETDAERLRRFKDDRRSRRSIQNAVWRLFGGLEVLTERWPRRARLLLNQITDGQSAAPLQPLMDRFREQRRWNAVWTSFICFLLYSYDEDTLQEMGLDLSEDLCHSLLDIEQALAFEGWPIKAEKSMGLIEDALGSFFIELLTDTNATATTNPLSWWVAVLVRSALSQGPDDYISRGRFNSNLMPMDLDVRTRLEALLHYSKILVLDRAFHSWEPRREWLAEVQGELNEVDNTWIGPFGGERPDQSLDQRKCESPAWKDILAHIEEDCEEFLSSQRETVTRQVLCLIR